MVSFAGAVCVALLTLAALASAQDAVIYVEVANRSDAPANLILRRPFTTELLEDLHLTKNDALMLYTDFATRAGADLKNFLTNFTGYAEEAIRTLDVPYYDDDPNECRIKFESRMKKIEHDARRAASYSGDSHHKFLLGYMIVFRMHLNKSEDYLKKCENAVRGCPTCDTTPRVKRWLRLASEEINRVRDDMQHTRHSYRDLVSHARRKMNHLRKAALTKTRNAIDQYKECLRG